MKKEIIIIEPKKDNDLVDSKEKLKVAAYARISTVEDEQANSLAAKRQYYETYIKLIVVMALPSKQKNTLGCNIPSQKLMWNCLKYLVQLRKYKKKGLKQNHCIKP